MRVKWKEKVEPRTTLLRGRMLSGEGILEPVVFFLRTVKRHAVLDQPAAFRPLSTERQAARSTVADKIEPRWL